MPDYNEVYVYFDGIFGLIRAVNSILGESLVWLDLFN